APIGGSLALNAGDPALLGTTDQRGEMRLGGVNIGAFQASATAFKLFFPSAVFPPTFTACTPFDMIVQASDPFGLSAPGYPGTVHFSSTDPQATLPADYTFTATDNGQHTFSGVVFGSAGSQTITVSTAANGFGYPSDLTANGHTA